MKKLIFSTILMAALFSCKKEEPVQNEAAVAKDSTATENTTAALKELKAAEVENLLKPKNNDTLYVTNFFATWCGPCKREMPDFKEQMNALKGKPVKFTFVSIDDPADWKQEVPNFVSKYGLEGHVVLFDALKLEPSFFEKTTKTWDGGSIPFTLMSKGNKTVETVGMLTQEELDRKLKSFN